MSAVIAPRTVHHHLIAVLVLAAIVALMSIALPDHARAPFFGAVRSEMPR